MRLGLVFPPYHYKVHEENFKLVMDNFGRYPPMALLYVAAIGEEAGHDVILIDAAANRFSKEEVLNELMGFKPDILGFMVTTYMFQETLDWIRYLKFHLNIPVVIGGFNMLIYPTESMSHPEIDYGIIGSAKYALPRLLSAISDGKGFGDIEGLCYKKNDSIVINKPGCLFYPLETLPFPARHLLDNSKYFSIISQRRNYTILFTSRGCPMGCNYCEEGRTPFYARGARHVVDEMEQCYRRYNIVEFEIFDISFTHDKNRVYEICNEILKRRLKIYWAIRSRIDKVDGSILRAMREAGCERIYYGIESGRQKILDNLNKPITLRVIEETIKLTLENKIKPLGFFMIGNPGEGIDDVKQTIRFAKRLGLHYAQFGKTTAKPKTRLHGILIEKMGQDYWSEYISGRTEPEELDRPWTDLTNEEVNYWVKRAYREFYLSPRYALRGISRLRSIDEFYRSMKAVFELVLGRSEKI